MWSYWLAPVASTKPRTGAQRQWNPELRGGEGGLAVVAALILAAVVQRLMLHAAVILDRAKRRSGQPKPFARGPHGDRKSVVSGQSVSVRVDLGGRRIIKQIS